MGFHVTRLHHRPQLLELVLQHVPRVGGVRRPTPWGPTAGDAEDREPNPPVDRRLPGHDQRRRSASGIRGANDLRQNPAISILASVDPSSFPVGTDPNQQWHSGLLPDHVDEHELQDALRELRPQRDELLDQHRTVVHVSPAPRRTSGSIQGIRWLAGVAPRRPRPPTPDRPHLPTAWYSVVNENSAEVRRRPRGRDGQRYGDPASTPATRPTPSSTSSPRRAAADVRISNRGNPAQALDVTT